MLNRAAGRLRTETHTSGTALADPSSGKAGSCLRYGNTHAPRTPRCPALNTQQGPPSPHLLRTMRVMAQGGTPWPRPPRPPPAHLEQSAPAQPSKHSHAPRLHTPWPVHCRQAGVQELIMHVALYVWVG